MLGVQTLPSRPAVERPGGDAVGPEFASGASPDAIQAVHLRLADKPGGRDAGSAWMRRQGSFATISSEPRRIHERAANTNASTRKARAGTMNSPVCS